MARGRAAAQHAPPFIDPPGYAQHRPETTLLYQLVERHHPAFFAAREAAGRPRPTHVQGEFEGCGARRMADTAALLVDEVLPRKPLRQCVLSLPFALRFLLAKDPETLTHVLGIVYRAVARYILKKARLTGATGETGAVTLIQRFGSALNLNIHFHMLFLDGAYLTGTTPPVFRRIAAPSAKELEALVGRIGEWIGRALEREGLLVRDCEDTYLDFDPAAGGPMDDLLGHSITYRVAMGPRAGQKVFTLQTVPAEPPEEQKKGVAQAAGFSCNSKRPIATARPMSRSSRSTSWRGWPRSCRRRGSF